MLGRATFGIPAAPGWARPRSCSAERAGGAGGWGGMEWGPPGTSPGTPLNRSGAGGEGEWRDRCPSRAWA